MFNIFYLQDSPDPLANSLLQPQFPETLVLELDWLHLRTEKNDPLILCIAGADSSFRLVEVNMYVPQFVLSSQTFLLCSWSLYDRMQRLFAKEDLYIIYLLV